MLNVSGTVGVIAVAASTLPILLLLLRVVPSMLRGLEHLVRPR